MDSREKQDLINEFGPVDGIDVGDGPSEVTQPGTGASLEFEFEDVEAGGNDGSDVPDIPDVPDGRADGDSTRQNDAPEPEPPKDIEPQSDLVFDFIGADGPGSKDQIGLDPVSAELAETKDKLLRLAAEFENFKKRRIRERDEQQRYANERVLKELLPVVDNLERALDSARQAGQAANLITGLDLVVHEFLRVLSREGVEPVLAVGRPFDPAYQEALQSLETNDSEPGTVVAEILRGYTLHGRVLRAGLVVVAKEPQNGR
ncbi:MAG TPA: nucleotide exchange factor GrpE [Myxococcota bacterium]|nr:nucleotide exchange factor GrpE [Myxococcota bacterium]HOA13864.1 nucleotide exchange factor GrpE [Myxococcota bacterium]HOH76402.1 nucleotide exchange factor GrpE [Myxococcota bacterium]